MSILVGHQSRYVNVDQFGDGENTYSGIEHIAI